jgi:hypothetical protein
MIQTNSIPDRPLMEFFIIRRIEIMKRYYLISAIVALIFTGCGGSSGGSGGASSGVASGKIVGVAAHGAALSGAQVEVVALGKSTMIYSTGTGTNVQNNTVPAVFSTTTDGSGNYSINLITNGTGTYSSLVGPFMVRVCDNTANPCDDFLPVNSSWIYSYISSSGVTNAHPLTDMIIQGWYSNQIPAGWQSPFSQTDPSVTLDYVFGCAYEQAAPSSATTKTLYALYPTSGSAGDGTDSILNMAYQIGTLISDIYPGVAAQGGIENVMSQSFTPGSGQGLDGVLDNLAGKGVNLLASIQGVAALVAVHPNVFSHYIVRSGICEMVYQSGATPTSCGAFDSVMIQTPAGRLQNLSITCPIANIYTGVTSTATQTSSKSDPQGNGLQLLTAGTSYPGGTVPAGIDQYGLGIYTSSGSIFNGSMITGQCLFSAFDTVTGTTITDSTVPVVEYLGSYVYGSVEPSGIGLDMNVTSTIVQFASVDPNLGPAELMVVTGYTPFSLDPIPALTKYSVGNFPTASYNVVTQAWVAQPPTTSGNLDAVWTGTRPSDWISSPGSCIVNNNGTIVTNCSVEVIGWNGELVFAMYSPN